MSLNGLDSAAIKEAHDTANAEPGGWYDASFPPACPLVLFHASSTRSRRLGGHGSSLSNAKLSEGGSFLESGDESLLPQAVLLC